MRVTRSGLFGYHQARLGSEFLGKDAAWPSQSEENAMTPKLGKKPAVKFALFIAAFVLAVTLGIGAVSADDPPTFRGAMVPYTPTQASLPAPLIPILDAKGNTLNFSDFHGKVVLLNLWATWCAPCLYEMPSLDRLQAEMGSDKFMVLALSIDREGLEVVTPFFKQLGLKSLAVFLDLKGKATKSFRLRGLPTSYIIDHRGMIAGELMGPAEWDTDEAKALMRYYIERIDDKID